MWFSFHLTEKNQVYMDKTTLKAPTVVAGVGGLSVYICSVGGSSGHVKVLRNSGLQLAGSNPNPGEALITLSTLGP